MSEEEGSGKRSYDEMNGSEDSGDGDYETDEAEFSSDGDEDLLCRDCGDIADVVCPSCDVIYVKPPLMRMEPGQLYMYKGYDAKK